MHDILPAQVVRWQEIERVAREVFALHGYREIRTPVVEQATLFARGVGETTDIVKKEMYVFEDKGEEILALRPEATAGLVRAYIEHGCHVEGLQKWFCMGPMFRREQPQKGRYRQFHQIDCECLGVAEPAIDVEQIGMLDLYLGRLGVRAQLRLNSVGDSLCRPAYLEDLRSWLTARKGELCPDCNERIERNPLRVLDCKVASCQPVLAEAPRLLSRLCQPCRAHFDAVQAGLDTLGVAYQIDTRIVRGLDYYVRTAYEFSSDVLGAQSAVAGGGRYDGLVETLGGQPTPGIGFALGEERLVMMMQELERRGARPATPEPGPAVFLISVDEAGAREALRRASILRKAGIACDLDPRGGKAKTQFKQAERVGARYALVLGGNEVASGEAKLKDMETRVERPVRLDDLAGWLASKGR